MDCWLPPLLKLIALHALTGLYSVHSDKHSGLTF